MNQLTDEQRKMVEDNILVAQKVARGRYRRFGGDLQELTSLCYLALVDVCMRHTPEREAEAPLSAWIEKRCRGALLDEARRSDHVPRSVRERVKSDTATHTEVALAEARPVLIDDRLALRLRAHQNPEREVLESRVTREFAAFVSLMSPEHKAVLALHYYAGLELRDIAKYFRVPESRVGQMHIKAIMAVRDFLAYRQ